MLDLKQDAEFGSIECQAVQDLDGIDVLGAVRTMVDVECALGQRSDVHGGL